MCQVVQEVVEDVLGITLTIEQVSFAPASKLVTLRAPGPVKTEILLMKEEILAHLKGRLGPASAPRDII